MSLIPKEAVLALIDDERNDVDYRETVESLLGFIMRLRSKIATLPSEPEPMVRWCHYKGGEPYFVFSQEWDSEDAVKGQDYRRCEIREVQNGA